MQMISFFLLYFLVSIILPAVITDYPFTSRPVNRNSRRDAVQETEFTSTTHRHSDMMRRLKPPYQGYLAFMLICGKLMLETRQREMNQMI